MLSRSTCIGSRHSTWVHQKASHGASDSACHTGARTKQSLDSAGRIVSDCRNAVNTTSGMQIQFSLGLPHKTAAAAEAHVAGLLKLYKHSLTLCKGLDPKEKAPGDDLIPLAAATLISIKALDFAEAKASALWPVGGVNAQKLLQKHMVQVCMTHRLICQLCINVATSFVMFTTYLLKIALYQHFWLVCGATCSACSLRKYDMMLCNAAQKQHTVLAATHVPSVRCTQHSGI